MISALLVSYNTCEQLRETLGRLVALPDAPDEIVVADNGSRDGTCTMLAREFPAVRLLELGANLGFGAANNRAAAVARGDRFLLLNSDAWPLPGTLAALAGRLAESSRIGLVGPRLRYADGRPVCYCENHCLPARVPELLRHDLNGSLTEIYQTHYDLIYTSMHLSFYPTSMPPQAAEALGVMEGRPALLLRRLNYDQHGRILDYDIEYWRHDSLRIEVDTH